jgi:hypothetical protein
MDEGRRKIAKGFVDSVKSAGTDLVYRESSAADTPSRSATVSRGLHLGFTSNRNAATAGSP